MTPAPLPTPYDIIDPAAAPYPRIFIFAWIIGAVLLAALIKYFRIKYQNRKNHKAPFKIAPLVASTEALLEEDNPTIEKYKSMVSILFDFYRRHKAANSPAQLNEHAVASFLYNPQSTLEDGKIYLNQLLSLIKDNG